MESRDFSLQNHSHPVPLHPIIGPAPDRMSRRRLTQRQKERIQAIQSRRREKCAQRAEQALETEVGEQPHEGVVITRHGQNLAVADSGGELHHCLFRQNIGHIVCGDRVVWQRTTPGHGVVTALIPRRSVLIRPNYSGHEKPLAANIDQLVVVLAPQPQPSQYLLDQYLVAAENLGLSALIAFNKIDLLEADGEARLVQEFAHYADTGYELIHISAKHEHGLDPLIERLQEKTSILLGQSGVGKSSLIKALLPDIRVQTGRLSETSGLGRHTTSATTLYRLPQGGSLIDSPGVRSFRLGSLRRGDLEWGFREFQPFLGHCRFSNCSHHKEPGCALVEAEKRGAIHPQRLANFRHMAQNLPA